MFCPRSDLGSGPARTSNRVESGSQLDADRVPSGSRPVFFRVQSGYFADMIGSMELQPSEPPGRANRKLRAYVSEIARLRVEGYTIEAIRKAFCAAGIDVGWTTVQREAARLSKQPPTAAATPATARRDQAGAAPRDTRSITPAPVVSEATKGKPKMGAEQFFAQHVDNPLIIRRRKP